MKTVLENLVGQESLAGSTPNSSEYHQKTSQEQSLSCDQVEKQTETAK
jgi:hypothetical protein